MKNKLAILQKLALYFRANSNVRGKVNM